MMSTQAQWLGTTAAADQLGITTRTLYKVIDTGALSAHRFGRVIRIQQSAIDTFLDRTRIEPGQLRHLYDPYEQDTPDNSVEDDEPDTDFT